MGSSTPLPQAQYLDDKLLLGCSTGDLPHSLDAFGALLQPIRGDFVLTARLLSFDPSNLQAGPLAGLVLQQDDQPGSLRAVYLVDAAGFLRRLIRSRPADVPQTSHDQVALPLWLRLIRDGSSIRFFTSSDGHHWELDDLLGMRLPEHAQVGFVACAPGPNPPATAAFDSVRLILGPPPMASAVPGLLLTHGSFLAKDLVDLRSLALAEDRVSIRVPALDSPLTFSTRQLARILYAPLSADDADHWRAKTGVLLKNGDFSEGRVHSIRGTGIRVESVLLGRRSHAAFTEAAGVFFRPPSAPIGGYEVMTEDGSRLRAQTLRGEGDLLHLEDPVLGWVTVPQSALVRIEVPSGPGAATSRR